MARLVLIHRHAGEAKDSAHRLRAAGHSVRISRPGSDADLKRLAERPPEAFVIDLGRLPSHGREIGSWLRRRKATRRVPLVFVGGEPDKVARVRELLPDAEYSSWRGIRGALRRALAASPAAPVTPGAMAGYSGTPLPRKLGIKEGSTLALLGAPQDFDDTLGELPPGVRIRRQARGKAELLLLFARSRAELARRFPAAVRAMAEGGGLWICWPKKASGIVSDVNQNHVRAHGLDNGLVDYKIAAIDATWSGLKFARRR